MATGTKTTKTFQNTLDDLIQRHKRKTGKTQNRIAEEIGIKPSALSAYMSDNMEAGINSLCKIADYLNVSADTLLGRTHKESKEDEMSLAVRLTGLKDESILCIQGLNATDLFTDTLNTIICSDEFGGIVALLQSCAEIKADAYGVIVTRAGQTVVEPSEGDNLYSLKGGVSFRLRDVLRSQYEILANSLYDTITNQLRPKAPKVKGFSITPDGIGPLQPPSRMKFRRWGDPLPMSPVTTENEQQAIKGALEKGDET